MRVRVRGSTSRRARLRDGKAAEGEGRARDALARDGVDLVDHLDAMHLQARLRGVMVGCG